MHLSRTLRNISDDFELFTQLDLGHLFPPIHYCFYSQVGSKIVNHHHRRPRRHHSQETNTHKTQQRHTFLPMLTQGARTRGGAVSGQRGAWQSTG